MANEKHLAILKQGVEGWNKWRDENPNIIPDLTMADLSSMDLKDPNLSRAMLGAANLSHVSLFHANLSAADLSNANLDGADIIDPTLNGANLSNTSLGNAIIVNADLCNANLSNANVGGAFLLMVGLSGATLIDSELGSANITDAGFSHADLSRAKLYGTVFKTTSFDNTIFSETAIFRTSFDDCVLTGAIGLDSVIHEGPSTIGIDTLYKSAGNISEKFLRGCGLKDWEIELAKLYRQDLSSRQVTDITYRVFELRTNPAIQFDSCFISYSSHDQRFSERLYADLQEKGVRCWFAPEHMKIGEKIRDRIDEAIRLQNRLLLVLSASSIESQWVEQEVETALEKERNEKGTILCPIRLDEAVMSAKASWASFIRKTRHIGDFSGWADKDAYQKALNRLLRDLKAEGSK